MKVLIAGASGLVGSALIPALSAEGSEVTRLVRTSAGAGEIEWHPNNDQIDAAKLEGFDAIINFAGENIAAGRWTDDQKRKIRDSRVNGTHLLSEAMAKLKDRPKVFLCASATGIYGDRGDEALDEQSDSGGGFLAGVCREWEKATEPAVQAGVRTVNLRFGPILAREGGMLAKLLTPFKMGMGGRVGSGKQFISWVAIDDAVDAIKLALKDESIRGPLNIVSPNPVTNEEFTKTLGHVLSRPTALAMPAFAVRLAFGEMADEMLLTSQRVIPKKLNDVGYEFQHPELEGALRKHLG
ncbi:MAG TPA: TIGR01777 family oxidoreductase [Pyrinomonadaceae bacterium]|nr:TIGR01777 family oxidoreductase [Pyrinomonadaceae bacterium]